MYNMQNIQVDGAVLEVTHFGSSVYLLSNMASALHMMLQRFGMICPMMFVQPLIFFIQKEVENLSLFLQSIPCFFLVMYAMVLTTAMSLVISL